MQPATAAILNGVNEDFELATVLVDEPRRNEVLVRMVATGLCHSDLSVRSDVTPFPLPAVLGHEGAGVVEAIGDHVEGLQLGDPVVLQSASCGRCLACLQGHPLHCDFWRDWNLGNGRRPDGSPTVTREDGSPLHGHFFGQSAFASYALAAERTVVKVPDTAPLWQLGPLGCGIQTGAQSVLEVLRPRPGDHLVVFGAGAVGLSAVIAGASLSGAIVTAVDVNPQRLSVAKELGATHALHAGGRDLAQRIFDATGGRGADFTLESSGVPAVLELAVEVLAPLGTCGIVGAPHFSARLSSPIIPLVAKGARLVGINQGEVVAQQSIPALTELLAAGRFPFDRLLTEFDFEDINLAVSEAQAGRAIKPVLRFPEVPEGLDHEK